MKLPSGWIAKPKVDRKGVNVTLEMSDLILCKDCKYFEYDRFSKVDGIPLIVAHEICKNGVTGARQVKMAFVF